MSWNYRIFKKQTIHGPDFFIGEAYYNKEGEFDGGYSDSYEGMVSADSLEQLEELWAYMAESFTKPVIELPPETSSNGDGSESAGTPDVQS